MAGKIRLTFTLAALILLASCNRALFPSDMYKVKGKASFSSNEELLVSHPIVIQSGDELQVSVYSNKGEKLLDPLSAASQISSGESSPILFTVDVSGNVDLPLAGTIHVAGKTTAQCEEEIKSLYARSVVEPFVLVKVTNKRVFFISGGTTQRTATVPYVNANTTLIDVITTAGGLSDGKAYSIRLIRSDSTGQKMYSIDLSDYSQVKYSYIQILPNDIVYVEPRHRFVREVFQELSPYLTLVSTVLLVYNLTR